MFGGENRLFFIINKILDMVVLNLLFLITSFPIITMGASLKALCGVSLRLVNGTESYIARNYFSAWKKGFKESSFLWILVLVLAGVSIADLRILPLMSHSPAKVCLAAVQLAVLFLLYGELLFYNFIPDTQSYSFGQTIKLALFLSVKYAPHTILCICITILPFTLMILFSGIDHWILSCYATFGFSLTAFLHAMIMNRLFAAPGHF